MSELPKGWCSTELGALIERIEAGLNVKCEERPPLDSEKGLVKISAVTWGQFNEEQSKTLPADSPVTEHLRIRSGDLLFSRANTIELVGATVLVGKISKNLYLSDKVLRLVVPEANKRWVNFALKTARTRKAIQEASSGNQLSMRNVSQEKLRQITIPLAPLPEQKRIADKLDSVLGRVDACRDRLNRIPALLKRCRLSILAAATSGRLTEDWREKHSVGDDWDTCQIGDLVKGKPRNGYSPKAVDYPTNVKSLTLSATTSGVFRGEHCKFIDERISPDSYLWLQPGDILIQRANTIEYVGVSAVFTGNANEFIYPDLMMKCEANEKVQPYYLYLMLSAETTRNYFRENATGTAGNMPKINQQTVVSAPALLPSLKEQAEIIRRVETLFAFADRLEARLVTARKQAEQLTPALLAKAFRGELVPQDPNDEPATELLKRLATTRTEAPKAKRGRKAAA